MKTRAMQEIKGHRCPLVAKPSRRNAAQHAHAAALDEEHGSSLVPLLHHDGAVLQLAELHPAGQCPQLLLLPVTASTSLLIPPTATDDQAQRIRR